MNIDELSKVAGDGRMTHFRGEITEITICRKKNKEKTYSD